MPCRSLRQDRRGIVAFMRPLSLLTAMRDAHVMGVVVALILVGALIAAFAMIVREHRH
jgi:hypothetical protein